MLFLTAIVFPASVAVAQTRKRYAQSFPLALSPSACVLSVPPVARTTSRCRPRVVALQWCRRVTMGLMPKEYVRYSEGAYRIGDARVSLDSLVYLFREGMSAESMVESYPVLTLQQVHGALAFYLGNQKEIDAYLMEGQRAAESQHEQSKQTNSELIAELQRARHAGQISG
jgi:uncharacterized protein (DUF433 family)